VTFVRNAFVGVLVLAGTAPAAAQNVEKPAVAGTIQARQQIASLETALEQAVRYGTQMLDQRLQASSAANMVMLAGMTRARGFRLEDYGVMFDVEFPSMRRSMVWSLQELQRANTGGGRAAAVRAAEEPAIQPRAIYQSEITDALVNALLDYRGSVGVGADEWLTIAARESVVDRRFVPGGDPNDMPITVMLRLKGAALQDLREKRISRDEARARIEVRTY
jgi:hypothetical protein